MRYRVLFQDIDMRVSLRVTIFMPYSIGLNRDMGISFKKFVPLTADGTPPVC